MTGDLVPVQKDITSSTGKTFKRTYWVSSAEAKQLVAEGKAKPVGAAPLGFKGEDWHALTDDQKIKKWTQHDAAFKAASTKQLGKIDAALAAGDTDTAKGIVDLKLGEMRDGMGDELFNKASDWIGQYPDAASAQAALGQLANHPIGAAMAQVYGKKWTQVADAMVQYGARAEKIPGSMKMFGTTSPAKLEAAPEKPATSVAMSESEAKQGIDHVVLKEFGGDYAAALAALHGPQGDQAAPFFQKALGADWKQKVTDHIKEKFEGNKAAQKAVDKVAKGGEKLAAAQSKADAAKQKWLDIKAKNETAGIKPKSDTEAALDVINKAKDAGASPLDAIDAAMKAPQPGAASMAPQTFTPTGEAAGGSQGGKWYKDEKGQRFFGKDYKGDMERLATEHIANGIYKALGISAPETQITKVDGKDTIMSKAIDASPTSAQKLADTNAKDGFVADAFMGNWDVVGLSADNMLVDKDGQAHRIDNGGSLFYRAQGGKKEFGQKVDELQTMRDPKINPSSAKVFGKLSDEDVAKQAHDFSEKYAAKRDEIHKMIDASPMSAAGKEKVKAALDARAEYIKGWANKVAPAPAPAQEKGLEGDGDGDGKANEVAELKGQDIRLGQAAQKDVAKVVAATKMPKVAAAVIAHALQGDGDPVQALINHGHDEETALSFYDDYNAALLKENVDTDGKPQAVADAIAESNAKMTPEAATNLKGSLSALKPAKSKFHEDVDAHAASMPPHIADAMKKTFGEDWQDKLKASVPPDDVGKDFESSVSHEDVAKATGLDPMITHDIHEAIYKNGVDPVDALIDAGYTKSDAEGFVKQYADGEAEVATGATTAQASKPQAGTAKSSAQLAAEHTGLSLTTAEAIQNALAQGLNPVQHLSDEFGFKKSGAEAMVETYHKGLATANAGSTAEPGSTGDQDVQLNDIYTDAIDNAVDSGADPHQTLTEEHGLSKLQATSVLSQYAKTVNEGGVFHQAVTDSIAKAHGGAAKSEAPKSFKDAQAEYQKASDEYEKKYPDYDDLANTLHKGSMSIPGYDEGTVPTHEAWQSTLDLLKSSAADNPGLESTFAEMHGPDWKEKLQASVDVMKKLHEANQAPDAAQAAQVATPSTSKAAPPMAAMSSAANSTIMSATANGQDPIAALVSKGYHKDEAEKLVAAKQFAVDAGVHKTQTVSEIYEAIQAGKDPAEALYQKYGMDSDDAKELVAGYHKALEAHAAKASGGFDEEKHKTAVKAGLINSMDAGVIADAIKSGKNPKDELMKSGLTPSSAHATMHKYKLAGGHVPGDGDGDGKANEQAPVADAAPHDHSKDNVPKIVQASGLAGPEAMMIKHALTGGDYANGEVQDPAQFLISKGMATSKSEANAKVKKYMAAVGVKPAKDTTKWKESAAKASATKAAKKAAQEKFASAEQELLQHKNSMGEKLGSFADNMLNIPGEHGGLKGAKDFHKDISPSDVAMTKALGEGWHQKLGKHLENVEKMQQAKQAMDALGPKKSKGSPKQVSAAKEKFIAEANASKAEAEVAAKDDFNSKVDMDGVPPHVHAEVAKIGKQTNGFMKAMEHLGIPTKSAEKMKSAIASWTGSANTVQSLQMRGAAIKIMAAGDPMKEKELLDHFEKSIDAHTGGAGADAQKIQLRKGFNDPVIAKTLQAAAVVAQAQYAGKKTVTLYRGVHGKQAQQLKANLAAGKPLVLGVHSMSCWSEQDKTAKNFASHNNGIVLKVEVPVSAIVHSYRVEGTTMTDYGESEVVIASNGKVAVQVHK